MSVWYGSFSIQKDYNKANMSGIPMHAHSFKDLKPCSMHAEQIQGIIVCIYI